MKNVLHDYLFASPDSYRDSLIKLQLRPPSADQGSVRYSTKHPACL
jgi:hypothetical protein